VVAKKSLRELLLKINREEGTTIFLTSHDVGDIEYLCERTIVINNGEIIKDLPTEDLAQSFVFEKYVSLTPKNLFEEFPELPAGISYLSKEKELVKLSVDINVIEISQAIKLLLDLFPLEDVDVSSAELEAVIRNIYEKN